MNKNPGIDGITTEAILASWEIGITWPTSIFQKAWNERKVPDDWQRAVIAPIWKKKGSKRDCRMYRGISILSNMGKMYSKVLEQWARCKVEPFLSEAKMSINKSVFRCLASTAPGTMIWGQLCKFPRKHFAFSIMLLFIECLQLIKYLMYTLTSHQALFLAGGCGEIQIFQTTVL